jgi:hypothetical protein
MAFAKVPYRLVSRRNLDKADVEANYAQLVQVIGGTYYSNGAPVGPANGTLDYRNFSPEAGIPNSYKISPYSVWAISIGTINGQILFSTPQTWYSAPVQAYGQGMNPDSYPPSMTVIGATLFGSSVSTTSVGSATFQKGSPGVTPTQIGTTVTWNNPPAQTSLMSNQTGLSVPLFYGEMLSFTGSVSVATASLFNPTAIFWIKSLHVR